MPYMVLPTKIERFSARQARETRLCSVNSVIGFKASKELPASLSWSERERERVKQSKAQVA
jgi:hypothetical protein